MLERIVLLRIGHGARIEPHVDQVALAAHRLALGRDEHDLVHIGTVQVDLGIVLLRHVAHTELLVGILLHHAGRDRALDLGRQLLHRTDAFQLGVILGGPHRQRRAPETRTRQIPVHQPFEPLAEAARTGRFGHPADRAVEFDHPLAQRRGPDEPRVERIVEHRFVRAPAMRIGVDVLLDLESHARPFERHGDVHVERRRVGRERIVVGVLHVTARILAVFPGVDIPLHEGRIELLDAEELARAVDHRLLLARAVDHEQGRDARLLGHAVVVGTERRGDMHDTRTVGRGHVVAHDHAEGIAHRPHPREQLLVADALELGSLVNTILDLERSLHLLGEVGRHQLARQNDGLRLVGIGVAALDAHIVDRGAYGQRRIRRQRPRRRRPGQEVELALDALEKAFAAFVAHHAELRRAGRVLHVAVAARLVQLVGRETRTRRRRVGLDGVALVEQPLVEELFEQPPQRLDILVVVGDVGIVHVDPVAHAARQVLPHSRELHDRLAAGAVVLLDRYFRPDILLRDAELLLHAQLDGQAVGVPSRLAVYQIALLRLVAADDVLDRARHDVMDARQSVGRGRPLVKDECRMPLARRNALVESVFRIPLCQHVGRQLRQIESFVLLELHISKDFTNQRFSRQI